MATILTHNQILAVIQDQADRHPQVESWMVAPTWDAATTKYMPQPCLHIRPTTGTYFKSAESDAYSVKEINIELILVDLVNKGKDNRNDVNSDTFQILGDFITELNEHPYYQRSGLEIVGNFQLENLEEWSDDEANGWRTELTFRLKNSTAFCSLPFAPIPGFSFPGPESTAVTYSIQYLTCATVTGCTTLQNYIQQQIDLIPSGSTANYYTTGATVSGQTIIFDRNDQLNAYNLNLSAFTRTFSGTNNYYASFSTGNTLENGIIYDDGVAGLTIMGTDNTSLAIVSPPGFYYPSLNFYNNGGAPIGGISAYAGSLYIAGVGAPFTPLQVSSVIQFPYLSGVGMTYLDSSSTLRNLGLGFGLQLSSGGTLSVTGTSGTDIFTTGGTYSAGTITIRNNTGGTYSITGLSTGYTPGIDVRVTGGTYANGTATFSNNTGGTFNVTGFYTGDTDVQVSGYSYNNSNMFTIANNTGGTFNATINTMTGLTVNGTLFATTLSGNSISWNIPSGDTRVPFISGTTFNTSSLFTYANNTLNLSILSANTINSVTTANIFGTINTSLGGSNSRAVEAGSGGTLTATKEIIDSFLLAGSAPAVLLAATSGWTGGNYTGTTITNTYQGQQFYNNSYYFVAVNDNDWIRMARI